MVFTRSLTSKFSSAFINPLVTVSRAPITTGINVTFMFHNFFNSLTRSRYLTFFSHSFNIIQWSAETAKATILQFLPLFFFFLIITKSVCLAKISGSVCISKYQRGLYLKIPERFVRLIFQNRFWVVQIPFVQISISGTTPDGSPCSLSRV